MDLQVGVKALIQKGGKFLVLSRNFNTYKDIKQADSWDIPGGRIQVGAPVIENLRREIREETALELTDAPKLLCAQDILRGTEKHVVRLTFLAEVKDGEIMLDQNEHGQYRWATREELLNAKDTDQYLRGALELLTHENN
jgi:8-oxo-dGTP diphosphatase